jgi:uncharacterized protein YjbJ (UPF0337 family)
MKMRFQALINSLRASSIALLAALLILSPLVIGSQQALAVTSHRLPIPNTFITMSNKADAAAKNAEGKLESALGDLTGDTGHQIKGKAKQVQASAMNAAEDIKEAAKSVGEKIADATDQK